MNALFSALEACTGFRPIDVELPRALARIAGERCPQVALAMALASRALGEGHVCLPLPAFAEQPILDEEGTPTSLRCPQLDAWRDSLARSALVGHSPDEGRPLVLDEHDRLYLSRYYDHELRVAQHLVRLAARALPAPALDTTLLDALFPFGPEDLQRSAVLASRGRALSLIVGGPGTGKTSTVVRLLALLVSDALRSAGRPPKILLTAPTGKAAQRLSEATARALSGLSLDPSIKDAIPTSALTLHRALKAAPGSAARFQHGAQQRLACDVLLLDEASMVDLSLMRHLLEALPDHARLILLGDPDQLSSVEAGGLLTDLCASAEDPHSPLSGALSRLERSYRYASDSGVGRLSRAIHQEQPDAALDLLRGGAKDVHFHTQPGARAREATLGALAERGYAGLRTAELDARLGALDSFRVLCAHRRGLSGVAHQNRVLAKAVHGARASAEHYAGRPLLITQNDYASALYNGDVGVEHASGRRRQLAAVFRSDAGGLRELSVARLPPHESVYAMTIHKSQGSEFDEVVILLPETPSPLMTRELLFTAVTRARKVVHVVGSEASLRAAIAQRSARHSGLVERLQALSARSA